MCSALVFSTAEPTSQLNNISKKTTAEPPTQLNNNNDILETTDEPPSQLNNIS